MPCLSYYKIGGIYIHPSPQTYIFSSKIQYLIASALNETIFQSNKQSHRFDGWSKKPQQPINLDVAFWSVA